MLLIREVEERIDRLFKEGLIGGTTHLGIGQEACAVGVCNALNADDMIVSTHRGHGHYLAKGGNAKALLAEIFGKTAGLNKGIGGSQHLADFSIGFMGSNGITGGGLPIAAGIALAEKLNKTSRVTVGFLGDGAVNQGYFHESMNLAAIQKLPLLFFCENNLYAMSTPFKRTSPVEHIADRAAAYNMPGITVDGNDCSAVSEAIHEYAAKARAGEGPALIEGLTYRQHGHSKSDQCEYRTPEEEAQWELKDPIKREIENLLTAGESEETIQAIREEITAEVDEAVAWAKNQE